MLPEYEVFLNSFKQKNEFNVVPRQSFHTAISQNWSKWNKFYFLGNKNGYHDFYFCIQTKWKINI